MISTGKQQNRPSRNHDETNSAGSVGAVYHDACGKRFGLPSIFEDVAEVEFASSSGGAQYVDPKKAFSDRALGPVKAIAGLIALLSGAFVFRRSWVPVGWTNSTTCVSRRIWRMAKRRGGLG